MSWNNFTNRTQWETSVVHFKKQRQNGDRKLTENEIRKKPTGKIEEKVVWRSVVLLYIALHIEYRFNRNSLLQSYFLVFFAGWE